MTKMLAEKIGDALSNTNTHGFAQSYLEAILTGMEKAESRFHQASLLMFFLFLVFELLTRAAISEVTVGPFKVNNLTLIQKGLPVVIAYLYYELCAFRAMVIIQSVVYKSIVKGICKPFHDNNLETIAMFSSTFDVEDFLESNVEGNSNRLIGFLSQPLRLTLVFMPLLFAAYAFYRCFSIFGKGDFLVWTSLVISALFLLQGMLILSSKDV